MPTKVRKQIFVILKKWFQDERSYWRRLLTGVFPVLALTFTISFWGAMETVLLNHEIIAISPMDVFSPLFILFIIVAFSTLFIITFIRGKYFDLVLGAIVFVAIASYIQIAFMNHGIGLIDGDALYFTLYEKIMNLVVWGVVLIVVATAWVFLRKYWARGIVFTSILLFSMQFGAFMSALPTIVTHERRGFDSGYVLSTENEFVLSSNSNTLVFILDAMSSRGLNGALDSFPHLSDIFRDFTIFDNSITTFDGTFPSMAYILTRQPFDFTRPTREYFASIWSHPETVSFYDALRTNNYEIQMFTTLSEITLYNDQIIGFADNYVNMELGYVNRRMMLSEMINLSLFRHVPNIFKPSLVPQDGNFYNIITEFVGYAFTVTNDIDLYQRLTREGLSTRNDVNMLIFNHMRGTHTGGGAGVNMDEFANYSPGLPNSDHPRQTAGSLWIVGEYMRQMRELGIYDNTNIIIIADHGSSIRPDSAFMIKRAGDRNEAIVRTSAPISHEDLWPTLVDVMNLNVQIEGYSVFDIPHDSVRNRTFHSWIWYEGFPNSNLHYNAVLVQNITGEATLQLPLISGGRRQNSGIFDRYPDIRLYPVYDSYYGRGWER